MSNTHFPNLSITLHNFLLFESATHDEQVNVLVDELPAFPPNSNPFHHDAVSMGSDIDGNYTMMMSGVNKEKHNAKYLVHGKTGQRHALYMVSKNPRPMKLLYLGEYARKFFKDKHFSTVCLATQTNKPTHYHPHLAGISLNTVIDTEGKPVNPNEYPIYWVDGCCAILYYPGVENELTELLEYRRGDYVDDKHVINAHKSMCKNLQLYRDVG